MSLGTASLIVLLLVSMGLLMVAWKLWRARRPAWDGAQTEQIAEVRSHLAAIVASSDDAILAKDLTGIIQSANAAAERMFGYTAAELVGHPITMLIPPDRQSEEVEILARLIRGERVDHFETVRRTKDGRLLDVSLTISPIRNASGQVIGASKIARDITASKRAASERERFRVTLASIGDAVIASDSDGRVTFMNGTAEELTGWTTAEARGNPLGQVFRIVDEKTRRPADSPDQVIRSGRVASWSEPTILIARHGTERPIEESAAPILDDSGRSQGLVLVFRDVTEQRGIEAERHAAALERERLLESERAARGEAERANHVKDEFVAMISHELRTPLNAILGWTQLLMSRRSDPEMLQHGLEVVERNTLLQAQLISDLLDVSRIVSGKLRLEIQSLDLVSTIESGIETIQHAADAKGIEIRRKLDTTLGQMVGDPARLQQVVWNLLSNAIKFTPKGGKVAIQLQRVESHAEITVADDGIGIEPELVPVLFERFRQSDATTTRRHGGLGLGLSIVKHLVELHGGKVEARSAGPGKGATFTVELPLSVARFPDRPDPTADEATSTAARIDGVSLENITVLVVEDEPDTRELIRRILETHQARVVTAASALEAMELLASVRPDILLSDIGLPEVDGYDLIRRVRQRKDAAGNIPAVALTAYARSEDRTRAFRAGYQAHVAKPVEPAELVITIASFGELLGGARKS